MARGREGEHHAILHQVVAQTLYGAAPLEALWLAVGSTPIVFLAGTMLSEPFTLPPRRWQRMLEAVVVALVFVLPYFTTLHLGTLGPSPQLAVLTGPQVTQ